MNIRFDVEALCSLLNKLPFRIVATVLDFSQEERGNKIFVIQISPRTTSLLQIPSHICVQVKQGSMGTQLAGWLAYLVINAAGEAGDYWVLALLT